MFTVDFSRIKHVATDEFRRETRVNTFTDRFFFFKRAATGVFICFADPFERHVISRVFVDVSVY